MTAGPQLRDIHLPPEPGWWPPAPGWWLAAALALLLLAWLGRLLWRRLRQRRRLRAIDVLVDAAAARFEAAPDGAALAAELSQLLRRAARAQDPAAAALHGEAWLHWLDGADPAAPFSCGAGRLLLDAPYRTAVAPDAAAAVLPLVRRRVRSIVEQAHG